MVIIVTGSVGTGKTILARKIADKLNLHYINVNKIIKKYDLAKGYDKRRKTKIVDIKKLNKALVKEINKTKNTNKEKIKSITEKHIKKTIKNKIQKRIKINNGIIIDSHLSHYLPKRYVDLCIVTKCDLEQLKKRLEKRKYPKEKIRENMDAEIFDICLNEAREKGHKIITIDTTKKININDMVSKIKKRIR